MGAIKKEHFDKEFITRTQTIIKNYKGTFNITLLLNCLLGLIVLPSEFYKRKAYKFFDKELKEYPEIKELIGSITTFKPTKYNRKTKQRESDKKSLKNLVKKVRNGISHQQIESVDNKGRWAKVTIRDFNTYNGNDLELEVTWTPKQLKQFALFVAESYKTEIQNIQP